VGEYVAQRRAALEDARTGATLVVQGVPSASQESNSFRVDLLASFEPAPGTVAFLGYGSTIRDSRAFAFSRTERQSDGFFVKVAYLIRR
jgi:hypothetical protein